MPTMINSVTEYTTKFVDIGFEKDHVSCQYCPLLETYSRNQCRRTGEYILDTRVTGHWCPLIDRTRVIVTNDYGEIITEDENGREEELLSDVE